MPRRTQQAILRTATGTGRAGGAQAASRFTPPRLRASTTPERAADALNAMLAGQSPQERQEGGGRVLSGLFDLWPGVREGLGDVAETVRTGTPVLDPAAGVRMTRPVTLSPEANLDRAGQLYAQRPGSVPALRQMAGDLLQSAGEFAPATPSDAILPLLGKAAAAGKALLGAPGVAQAILIGPMARTFNLNKAARYAEAEAKALGLASATDVGAIAGRAAENQFRLGRGMRRRDDPLEGFLPDAALTQLHERPDLVQQLWKEYGTLRGTDNKLRQEISDAGLRLREDRFKKYMKTLDADPAGARNWAAQQAYLLSGQDEWIRGRSNTHMRLPWWGTRSLASEYTHPAFAKAYPEIWSQLEFKRSPNLKVGNAAFYPTGDIGGKIKLGVAGGVPWPGGVAHDAPFYGLGVGRRISQNDTVRFASPHGQDLDINEPFIGSAWEGDVLTHELSHPVQEYEGFNLGGAQTTALTNLPPTLQPEALDRVRTSPAFTQWWENRPAENRPGGADPLTDPNDEVVLQWHYYRQLAGEAEARAAAQRRMRARLMKQYGIQVDPEMGIVNRLTAPLPPDFPHRPGTRTPYQELAGRYGEALPQLTHSLLEYPQDPAWLPSADFTTAARPSDVMALARQRDIAEAKFGKDLSVPFMDYDINPLDAFRTYRPQLISNFDPLYGQLGMPWMKGTPRP